MKEIKDRLKDLYLKIYSLDLPICGDEKGFMIHNLDKHRYVVKIGEKGKPIHIKLNTYTDVLLIKKPYYEKHNNRFLGLFRTFDSYVRGVKEKFESVYISFGAIEYLYNKEDSELILKAIEELEVIKGNKEIEEDKDILLQISELLIINL